MQSDRSRMGSERGSERGSEAEDALARVLLPYCGCEVVRSCWVADRCDSRKTLCLRNAIYGTRL